MAVVEPRAYARRAHARGPEPGRRRSSGYNVFEQDRAAGRGARTARARGWADERASARVGEIAGGEALEWGRQANENPPVLRTHDRYGHRIDEVEFHPA